MEVIKNNIVLFSYKILHFFLFILYSTPYGKLVALEYLKFFDFHNESITESLQKFLKAFHLSGETQERERILIPFSKRYQECNNPDYGSEGKR